MESFWRIFFTCGKEIKNSESEDAIGRKLENIPHDIITKNKRTAKKEKKEEGFTCNGDEIINESPKVTISDVFLREHNYNQSDVFSGTLNNRDVAIRVIKKEFTSEAIKESELLSKLEHHEHIIKFHFKFHNNDYIYIVTEHYKTSLEDYIETKGGDKDLSAKDICLQLTEAVDFIHKQKVIYLNLNPKNIHIVGSRGVQKVKLTNFTNAVQWTEENSDLKEEIPLIDGFIAPEHYSTNVKQDFATDIYMLGCLFYYIITNGLKLPNCMYKQEQSKVFEKFNKYQTGRKTSDVVMCFDITTQMIWFLKEKRTSIELILKHPFFWSTEKLLTYIIDVAVRIEEKDKNFFNKLETKKRNVVGNDWTRGLDDIYLEISKGRDYDGTSVVDLVKTIRNRIVHTSTSRVAEVMRSSKEDLKNYWLGKFPHLIPHLYRTMNGNYR
ncbi:unnamed protein product [Diamesa hyperborea]